VVVVQNADGRMATGPKEPIPAALPAAAAGPALRLVPTAGRLVLSG
jgi:hypothetical protein